MAPIKSQNSNMLLAFLTLLGVIAVVAVVGFFMLRKGPEIIQGQAEVTEYRVSSKVPGRILEFRVKEGQSVNAGDTLAILEAPDVVAKMEQARAAEAFSEETPPCIGRLTMISHFSFTRRPSPFPSAPTTMTIGPVKLLL